MSIKKNKVAKVIAAVMFSVMLLLAFLSSLSAFIMAENNVYADGGISMREDVARSIFYYNSHVYFDYADELQSGELQQSVRDSYEARLSRENSNLAVIFVMDSAELSGEAKPVIYTNYIGKNDYQYKFSTTMNYSNSRTDWKRLEVVAYLQPELTAKDAFYYVMPMVDFLIAARSAVIWISVICGLLAAVCLIFLICAAGYREGCEGIYETAFDRLPFDVLGLLYFFGVMMTLFIGDSVLYGTADVVAVTYIAVAAILWVTLAVKLFLTLSVRIKARTLLKNTLIWRILKLLLRGLVLAGRVLARLPLWWKTGLGFVVWTFFEFLFLAFGYGEYTVFWIITRPLMLVFLVYCVLMLRRLQKAGKELSGGNTGYRVDTKYMLPDFKRHGDDLNNLSAGLTRAVDERMKSERMRSELITNVSHDIKTPLTSIINYVDLLKLKGLDSPDAPEYLAVLDTQSSRLKKLTEDLIEASKAASGSISCTLEPTDVNVLLSQSLGEYEERLGEAHIEPIPQFSAESTEILADGRLLWRVFDNLLSNIRKYAMPNTRAYFSTEVRDGNVVITVRNISDQPLDICAEELTERFVRGDASRHTEGSGLGLSIARSLTELQGGTFNITVDGDLFKVTVTFVLCDGAQ